MNISITSRPEKDYLFIEAKGIITNKEELLQRSQLMFAEASKYNFEKILIYQPETHFPPELFPYFDLVKDYEELPERLRQLKIAIVIADQYKELGDSWAALCISRGLQFNSFTSLDEAKFWLL